MCRAGVCGHHGGHAVLPVVVGAHLHAVPDRPERGAEGGGTSANTDPSTFAEDLCFTVR